MKKFGMLFATLVLLAACNRSHDSSGRPVYMAPAGPYAGTFNGSPAFLRLDKEGDRVSGTLQHDGMTQTVSGWDKGTVALESLSGPTVSIVLQKKGDSLEVVSGGTGNFVLQ